MGQDGGFRAVAGPSSSPSLWVWVVFCNWTEKILIVGHEGLITGLKGKII